MDIKDSLWGQGQAAVSLYLAYIDYSEGRGRTAIQPSAKQRSFYCRDKGKAEAVCV